jgi:hypothetical protein
MIHPPNQPKYRLLRAGDYAPASASESVAIIEDSAPKEAGGLRSIAPTWAGLVEFATRYFPATGLALAAGAGAFGAAAGVSLTY